MLGFGIAAALYKFKPTPFISEAKLFVRYVVSEGRSLAPGGMAGTAKSPDRAGETIMTSEVEILTSVDLAKQVAEAVGPAKILENPAIGNDLNFAAMVVNSGLSAIAPPRSSIIHLTFTHNDPQITQLVLRETVDRYLKMHSEIHRSKGSIGDFLIQETDQFRSRLAQTEEELRKVRNRAGVISIEDAKKTLTEQMAMVRQQVFQAQADLAQRSSMYQELTKDKAVPIPSTSATPDPVVPHEKIEEYKIALSRVVSLQRMEQELLTQYTAGNTRVKDVRALLGEAETSKRKLEQEFPALVNTAPRPATPAPQTPHAVPIDGVTFAAELNALQAKIKTLTGQYDALRAEAAKVDAIEGEISQLKRKKDLEESNYRLFAASLEQSRIAEALGDGHVSNITQIQAPSPPVPNLKKRNMLLGGIAGGGIAIGLAWAFLIELYLDRTLRRPIDVERFLKLPLYISIPVLKSARRRKRLEKCANGTEVELADQSNPHRVFYETLRDRLISMFESRGLVHKPKLIAVTGLQPGAGVTTTATGLARSLSETGDGNVLLVDMTVGQGSSEHFVKGKAVCGLDALLDQRDDAHVEQNLYVVSENNLSDRLSRNMPLRFTKLVPRLKASDFDYIIFDMPTVSQISITPRLASFMDTVLLVVESEKTDRDLTRRAADLLAQSKTHVGVILNKARSHTTNRLHREFLAIS